MLVIKLTDNKANTTNSKMRPKQAKNCTAMNQAFKENLNREIKIITKKKKNLYLRGMSQSRKRIMSGDQNQKQPV